MSRKYPPALTRARLATAFAQSGRQTDALAHPREAVRLSPPDANLHALFAQVLAGTGQVEQPHPAMRRRAPISPDLPSHDSALC